MWKKKLYGRTGRRWQRITAHAHCMLHNEGYRHTLRICNSYCLSTTTKLTRTHVSVTFKSSCLSYLIQLYTRFSAVSCLSLILLHLFTLLCNIWLVMQIKKPRYVISPASCSLHKTKTQFIWRRADFEKCFFLIRGYWYNHKKTRIKFKECRLRKLYYALDRILRKGSLVHVFPHAEYVIFGTEIRNSYRHRYRNIRTTIGLWSISMHGQPDWRLRGKGI